jgi:hypothetical protein
VTAGEFLPSNISRASFYKFALIVGAQVVEAKNEAVFISHSDDDPSDELVDLDGLDGFCAERSREPCCGFSIFSEQSHTAQVGFLRYYDPVFFNANRLDVLIEQRFHYAVMVPAGGEEADPRRRGPWRERT